MMKIAISVAKKEKAKGAKSPYFRALRSMGVSAEELVLLSAADRNRAKAEDFDGILFTGGEDVDPSFYDETKKYPSVVTDRARDEFELALLRAAREQQLPVLGICRGMQMINVGFGGSLYQDLKRDPYSETGLRMEHRQAGNRGESTHAVTLTDPESFLGAAFRGSCRVNSLHHQAVRRVGRGLKVTAYSEDGLPEALEDASDYPFLVAVQWHPEEMADQPEQRKLFEAFLAKCSELAERRAHAARTA
jgi:putative glutamine amidotransferase